MVAPVSVTLLADLSAQPCDNSVDPTVAAWALGEWPTPMTSTSVRLRSRITRTRRLGTGRSRLAAAVADMGSLPSGLWVLMSVARGRARELDSWRRCATYHGEEKG